MPVLIKKNTHAWLKRIIEIINESKPQPLESAWANRLTFANKKKQVDKLLDNLNCDTTLQTKQIERLFALKRLWSELTTQKMRAIPQTDGLLVSAVHKFQGKDKEHRENLLAYYINKVMGIYEIIFVPSSRSFWVENAQDFEVLVALVRYLLDQMNQEFCEAGSSFQISNRLPFDLIDAEDSAYYELVDLRGVVTLHSESKVIEMSIAQQQALALRAEDLERQLANVTRELEETTALCAQRQETIEKLTDVVIKVQPALENARRERDAALSKLARTEQALKDANELLGELMNEPEAAVSPLRANGHFSPKSAVNPKSGGKSENERKNGLSPSRNNSESV